MPNSTQATDTDIKEKDYLARLKSLLGVEHRDKLYCCIADLSEIGICQSRFDTADRRPDRQLVTQYLANWFKHAGLSEEECRDWLTDYAVTVLSAISSSSLSRIHHSTKSNIKYIYRNENAFDCGCENNPFKARCIQACPIYGDMAEKAAERKRQQQKEEEERWKRRAEFERSQAQKKAEEEKRKEDAKIRAQANRAAANKCAEERWFEACGEACEIAQGHRRKGWTMRQTAQALNDAGFRTSLGRLWSDQTINHALKRYQKITGAVPQDTLFSDTELKKLESQKTPKKTVSRKKKPFLRPVVRRAHDDDTQGSLF